MAPFCVITLTYGRVHHLSEAIQSFLVQDYTGPKEMLVYNTLRAQALHGNFPNVNIINAERPPSLGATRNEAISLCPDDAWIFVLDDDDLWLPGHLSTFAKHTEGNDWLWMDRQFYANGRQIKSIVSGSCPVFAFRKRVWKEVGGYDNRDCGEDRSLIGKITQRFPGKRIPIAPHEATFIYSFADGNYHLSGMGDDTPGRPSGHDRIEQWTMDGVRSGRVPSGDITIIPAWQSNYAAQARAFLETSHPDGSKKNDCCIILLGRFGDIINALPIAKHIHDNYGKPFWMVSREFASIFDGVSYVSPYVVDLHHVKLEEAMKIARKEFKHVLQAQIYGGPAYPQERKTPAFNMESWRNCGFLHKFEDATWKPEFDRRSPEREEALYLKVNPGKRPMVLVNTTKASSSPWPMGPEILEDVRTLTWEQNREWLTVDLAKVTAQRIYDLLGLMDQALSLWTIDSATLHLAAASPRCPVVAITNPKEWLGSQPRCNVFRRANYDSSIDEILGVRV